MPRLVHPTAVLEGAVELGENVTIGPFSVLRGNVRIGDGSTVHSHVVLEGPAVVGSNCEIFSFAVLGAVAQRRERSSSEGKLRIGNQNVIREHVTIHRGTSNDTIVGNACLLMAGCHVAHDSVIGSNVTIANGVQLAGHVVVEDYATFSGLAAVAQHCVVGESAFIAGGAMCERDVPPYVIVQGDRARVRALNKVGLRRRGIPEDEILALSRAYRALYLKGETPAVADMDCFRSVRNLAQRARSTRN